MTQKPSPITPEASRALASKKAHTEEMTVLRYYAMCRSAGVSTYSWHINPDDDSIVIRLTGQSGSRNAESVVVCPKGHPFATYAAAALEEFRSGLAPSAGIDLTPTETAVKDLGFSTIAPVDEISGMSSEPSEKRLAEALKAQDEIAELQRLRAENAELRGLAEGLGISGACAQPAHVDPFVAAGVEPTEHPTSNPVEDPAAKAKAIALQAAQGDPRKPAPAGKGHRKPLGLPLCEVCKAQPVYGAASKHCSNPECAKQWHMDHARRTNRK